MRYAGVPGGGRVAKLAAWLALSPFYATVGLFVLARWTVDRLGGVRRFRGVMQDVLTCPDEHPNSVVGRWTCDVCGGDFVGWVGRCEVCGDESASWFPCERCSLAVRLPWRP